MLPHSYTAVVTRNEVWQGEVTTEPYEAGWAHEAVFFVRALAANGRLAGAAARVQISPDGIRWVDEGTTVPLPAQADAVTFCKVTQFGNWLRLAARVPDGASVTALVAIALKA